MEANPIAYNAGNGAHYAADAGVPREIVANIKRMVQAEIADSSSGTEAPRTPEQRSEAIKQAVYECAQTVSVLSPAQVQALSNELVADFLGYGPLEPLLDDESITEIMVNSSDGVFVEQNGLIHAVPRKLFDTEDDIVRIIDRIASETGRHCAVPRYAGQLGYPGRKVAEAAGQAHEGQSDRGRGDPRGRNGGAGAQGGGKREHLREPDVGLYQRTV